MKTKLILTSLFAFFILSFSSISNSRAQTMGVSFSYFFPKNGYMSTVVSPFSIRGLGLKFSNIVSVETGFSLYRMAGMNITGMDSIESDDPMLGPNFTIMVPLQLVLKFGNEQHQVSIKGGGFFFYSFNNKLDYGHIDKAIREHEGWDVANSNFSISPGLGLGWVFGAEYLFFPTDQFGIKLGANYYIGGANLNMKGDYWGGPIEGPNTIRNNVEYPDSQIDYTGFELTFGVVFKT